MPAASDLFLDRPDGTRLLVRRDDGASPPAVVVVTHGFGEHGQLPNYTFCAARLVAAGYDVVRWDARGHGGSTGVRGHLRAWTEMRDDLGAVIGHVRATSGAVPIVLLGLSAGAVTVLDFAIRQGTEVAAVVAMATPLGVVGAPRWMRASARLLARVVPRLPLPPRLELGNLTRDAALAAPYLADPLFHQRATAGAAAAFFQTMDGLRCDASQLSVPLLLVHGSDDRIAPYDTRFFDAVCAPKTLLRYAGARHNLLLETNRDEIVADITAWLGDVLAGRTARPQPPCP